MPNSRTKLPSPTLDSKFAVPEWMLRFEVDPRDEHLTYDEACARITEIEQEVFWAAREVYELARDGQIDKARWRYEEGERAAWRASHLGVTLLDGPCIRRALLTIESEEGAVGATAARIWQK